MPEQSNSNWRISRAKAEYSLCPASESTRWLRACRGRAGGRYSAKTEKTGTKIRRAATGLPAARRAREPGSYKVSGSGEMINDSTTEPPAPTNQASRSREVRQTAHRPRTGATAWSPSGDATNSTVHVRERNSRFFAYAGSTRRMLKLVRTWLARVCRLRAYETLSAHQDRVQASCEILRISFGQGKTELAVAANYWQNFLRASPRCIVATRGESEICLLCAAPRAAAAPSVGALLLAARRSLAASRREV